MTYGEGRDHGSFNVDICATLLTDKAPKLPLREELPSLGFEVIYHAAGIGVKASKNAAERAARKYRKMQEKREKKKWRILPRTAKQFQEKFEKRQQEEIEIMHSRSALSYDSYNTMLKDAYEYTERSSYSSGSSGRSVCPSKTSSIRDKQKNIKKAPHKTNRAVKRWKVFKFNKTDAVLGVNKSGSNEEDYENVEFPDVLSPMNLLHDSVQTNGEFREDMSGSSSECHSFDYSSISSVNCENDSGGVKMLFVTSRSTRKYLPDITSTDESDDGSNNKRQSDAYTDNQQVISDYNLCTDSYAIAHNALDCALEKTFPDFLGSFESMNLGFGSGGKTSPQPVPDNKRENFTTNENSTDANRNGDIKNAFSGVDMLFTAGSDVLGAASEVIVDGGIALSRIGNGMMGTMSKKEPDATLDQSIPKDAAGSLSQSRIQREGDETGEQPFSRLSSDWLSAAVSAFGSIAVDFYNSAAGLGDEKNIDFLSGTGTVEDLFSVLGNVSASVDHVQNILSFSPEYIQIKRHHDQRLPLHVLCGRGFPDRSTIPVRERMHFLLQDVGSFRDTVVFVKEFYPNACLLQDAAGDLPVHLLSRTFMCWEAQWYEAVYEAAAKDQQSSSKTAVAITYLYQLMSECVEIVLEPIVVSTPLCKLPGSIGKILPLHIASIFTSSVKTLRTVLRAYSEAAFVKCDLGDMKTFVPNHVIPLELHDLLSTDFPKWEIQKTAALSELSWSASSQQPKEQDMEDCIRRSDLLFAFNPISPYRYEKSRIRRLEARIEHEANQAVTTDKGRMSYASERIWLWMCTFSEEKTGTVTYLNSVKRISNALEHNALTYLISIENEKGKRVFDVACRHCITVLQKRLAKLSESTKEPTGRDESDAGVETSRQIASISSVWQERQLMRNAFNAKGTLNHLCRLIFNMSEYSFPTSFIVLPYKLTVDDSGVLGVESSNAVDVALNFADQLLEITDPRSMLYYLDAKSTQYYGESLYGVDENPNRLKAYEVVKANEKTLLSLYESGEAYLYLVDELTGIPVLSPDNAEYPIVLNDSVNLVRKLLPLMLIGMLQLRGERSLSIMVSILLDGSVVAVPPKWVDAAKIAGTFYSSILSQNDTSTSDSSNTADELVQFISTSKNRLRSFNKPKNGTTEWNVELSILKMLLEMTDSDRFYDGLCATKLDTDIVLWTKGEVKTIMAHHQAPGARPFGASKNQPESTPRRLLDIFRANEERSESSSASSLRNTEENIQDTLPQSSMDSGSEEALNFPQPHFCESFHTSCSIRNEQPLLPYFSSYDSDEPRQTLPAMDSVSVFLPNAKREELFPKPRYAFLFDQLAIQSTAQAEKVAFSEPKRIFDEGGRIWSEISSQLERGFYEDASTLRLRVDIAQQAKHTSSLNKKMHELLELHTKIASHSADDVIQWEWSRNGYNTASDTRKLILRLSDLEDRILLDAIDLQHATIRAYALAEDVNWVEEERTDEEEIYCDRIIMSRDEAEAEELINEDTREIVVMNRRTNHFVYSRPIHSHNTESSSDSLVLNGNESEPERYSYINKTSDTLRGPSQHSSTTSAWGSSRQRYIHNEEVASRDDESETSGRLCLPTSISFQQALLGNRDADLYDYDSAAEERVEI